MSGCIGAQDPLPYCRMQYLDVCPFGAMFPNIAGCSLNDGPVKAVTPRVVTDLTQVIIESLAIAGFE